MVRHRLMPRPWVAWRARAHGGACLLGPLAAFVPPHVQVETCDQRLDAANALDIISPDTCTLPR
jgi:hypothetical protein